jgi:hypothetical protein
VNGKTIAGGVAISLALSAVALAQAPGSAPGQPRSIVPPRVIDAPLPPPQGSMPPTDAGSESAESRAALRPSLNPRGPAIEVGALGNVEGPTAGLIDDSSGGLGAAMWQGIDRAGATALLKSLPASSLSEAQRLLMRKALVTASPPPAGAAEESFNALRLTRLTDAGLIDDAADLALQMSAPGNLEIVRAQANALILAGREEMCGDLTSRRLESAEPFWAELRAYCYAAAGDTAAYDLTRSVIEDQGIVDPAFLVLLDGIAAGKGTAPEIIRLPDALQLLMLQKLKLPVLPEIEAELGVFGSLSAAASVETPAVSRVQAAEKAMRAGILPTPVLARVLDTYSFTPQSLNGAPARARGEPLMSALGRLRAALKLAGRADAKVELVHSAFEVGQREGVLGQVALLFADDAAGIYPARDWTNWAELMVRGLLLAGQSDAAARWTAILTPGDGAFADLSTRMQLTLALVAPDIADEDATREALTRLGTAASSYVSRPPPEALGEAALMLGLFAALDRDMPPEAEVAAVSLMKEMHIGRPVEAALMQRIERAAASGGRGQLALSVVSALGIQGVKDLAPDGIVRLVRTLRIAGIADAADALAMEALLLRPAVSY